MAPLSEGSWLAGPVRAAMRSRWMDAVLRRRAADIMRQSGLGRHLPAEGRLLDLGAGFGHLAERVLRGGAGRCCVGLDPVSVPFPPLARRMREAEAPASRLRLVRGSGTALPFASGGFDAAYCAFVLHHLVPQEQERALAEVRRAVRPGGVFVLIEDTPSDPAEWEATLRSDRRLNMEDDAAPHHYRAPEGWRRALAAHGFEVAEERGFTGVFPRVSLRRVPHRAFVCRG